MKPDDGLLAEGGAALALVVDLGVVVLGDVLEAAEAVLVLSLAVQLVSGVEGIQGSRHDLRCDEAVFLFHVFLHLLQRSIPGDEQVKDLSLVPVPIKGRLLAWQHLVVHRVSEQQYLVKQCETIGEVKHWPVETEDLKVLSFCACSCTR